MKKIVLAIFLLSAFFLPTQAKEPLFTNVDQETALNEKGLLEVAKEAFEKDPNSIENRTNYARHLLKSGKYEEALKHYLWCFEQGAEHEPEYKTISLQLFVAHISDFDGKYKPATDALIEIRNNIEKNLLTGQTEEKQTLSDILLVNKSLSDGVKKNFELFDALKKQKRTDLASSMTKLLRADFIKAKRYSDIIENAGDVSERLSKMILLQKTYAQTQPDIEVDKKFVVRLSEITKKMPIDFAKDHFIAFLGTNNFDQAKKIAQMTVDFDPTQKTYSLFIETAKEFNANDLAKELSKQFENLPPKS
jgi:tetratricopeptide (TPR) repeat protein